MAYNRHDAEEGFARSWSAGYETEEEMAEWAGVDRHDASLVTRYDWGEDDWHEADDEEEISDG